MSITQYSRRATRIALAVAAVAMLSASLGAQADTAMKKDAMKKDAMAKDAMMKDDMMKSVPHALNLDAGGVALHGYDPVAYFVAGKPAAGNAAYTATHNGATYRFATGSNRDAFERNPDRYAPQFGGYCAMGVALNKKLDVDPDAWSIVDGKLYLNVSKKVQSDWKKDVPGNIAKADKNWPAIRAVAAKDL